MSLESITDGCARVLAGVAGMKAAHGPDVTGYSAVQPMPQDVTETPVALVWYDHFELSKVGSYEVIHHYVNADLYFASTTAAQAEAEMLPIVTLCVAAFRQSVGLFGQATVAKIQRGGPARPEKVNGKPFNVFPITIIATVGAVQDYQLGPGS